MTSSISVSSTDVCATIDVEEAGRLSSVKWRDLEVVVGRQPNPLAWGWYSMAPWAGRVAQGRLDTPHGIEYLPTNLLPPHAIHGLLFDARIHIGQVTDHEAMVWCELPKPFHGAKVEQRISVGESSLTWSVSYRNGDRAMPAWLGFHPWFRRTLTRGGDVEVFNPATFMMELDDEQIPNGTIHDVTPPPWDDVFGGLQGSPTLTWPGALKITCTADTPWWVIYTSNPAGICIEPQTSPPNAAANGLAPILSPGEEIRLDYQLDFESA